MSWVRVPPEAAHFFLGNVTALGVLCCFALFVCLTLLASFFFPSHLSFKNMYICIILHSWKSYTCTHVHMYTCILDCQDCPEIDLAAQYKKCEPKQLPPSSVLKHFHQCFSEHMSELYM